MTVPAEAVRDDAALARFAEALAREGYVGDLETGLGARHVAATDNSVYQVLPAAIAYPACGEDVGRLVRAARVQGRGTVPLTARGGNTGTNGQSLNGGVIVDFARHMNRILDIAVDAREATVEPGVVLDQLNAALRPHGLFFPPMVSTASRATLGGMVATDASGKGSRKYGRTSDHVLELDCVLSSGETLRFAPMDREAAARRGAVPGMAGDIYREALRIATDHGAEIVRVFPDMVRGLTGYNLGGLIDPRTGLFSLIPLIAGSEGTLALIKAIRLKLAPLPSHRALVVLRYASFDAGLTDVQRLLRADPLAIEILDEKVVAAARSDVAWPSIEAMLGSRAGAPVEAVNFVEFVASDAPDLERQLAGLDAILADGVAGVVDVSTVRDGAVIASLWKLREKAVGLLARSDRRRQGTPFVEDTAVPPRHLPSYVREFRALLDRRGLAYGMFGHADVGCLHVRPLLDMKDPDDASLLRPISEEVVALTKRYGGLLWGEHGRGYRGEFSPDFFGPVLYPELATLKRAFDPDNLLNPGKLASPDHARPVERIDAVALRGEHDRRIGPAAAGRFDHALACNGNGACFGWDARDAMCPSYKASRDRAQSPKGRAALLRGWAAAEGREREVLEASLAASLATCLSCKACATQCPVQVDIPAMRSRFFQDYHARHRRPLSHTLLRRLDLLLALGRRFPAAANLVGQSRPAGWALSRLLGLRDIPRFSSQDRNVHRWSAGDGPGAADDGWRDVAILEDGFTGSFDAAVCRAVGQALRRLGYRVRSVPAGANGKVLHLLGERGAFAAVARKRADQVQRLVRSGLRVVGVDAATGLLHEHEYREFEPQSPPVVGLEQLLAADIQAGRLGPCRPARADRTYRIAGHCTEVTMRPAALAQWAAIFGHFGMRAEPVRTGCCGMAGLFGHEERHAAMSGRLYDLSWRGMVEDGGAPVLATGYSCRSQAMRLSSVRLPHPIEILASALTEAA